MAVEFKKNLTEAEKKQITERIVKAEDRSIDVKVTFKTNPNGFYEIQVNGRRMETSMDDFHPYEKKYIASNASNYYVENEQLATVAKEIFNNPKYFLKAKFQELEDFKMCGGNYLKFLLGVAQNGLESQLIELSSLDKDSAKYTKKIDKLAASIKERFEKEYGMTYDGRRDRVARTKENIRNMSDFEGSQPGA